MMTHPTQFNTTGTTDPDLVVPTLNLQNLLDTLQLLELAIKRGAYEPNELRKVSDVYEKIEIFLQYEEQKQAALAVNQGE
jgi:hypothetical protein